MTAVDTALACEYSRVMLPTDEKILLDQARDGSQRAFAQLVEAHSEKTIALAWRLVGQRAEAEDIAQEAFLRLFKGLVNFRGESSIGTWLYRTTTRLAIDHLRRERLKRRIFFFRDRYSESFDPLESSPDPASSPQDQLLAKETGARMQRLLQQLPPRQKAVFVLRHMEGLPLKEIAAVLGLEEGTVKAHLHRAVSLFRKEFREEKEEES